MHLDPQLLQRVELAPLLQQFPDLRNRIGPGGHRGRRAELRRQGGEPPEKVLELLGHLSIEPVFTRIG